MSVLQHEDSPPPVPPTGKKHQGKNQKGKKTKHEISNGTLTEATLFEIINVSRYLDLHFVCLAVNEWLLEVRAGGNDCDCPVCMAKAYVLMGNKGVGT